MWISSESMEKLTRIAGIIHDSPLSEATYLIRYYMLDFFSARRVPLKAALDFIWKVKFFKICLIISVEKSVTGDFTEKDKRVLIYQGTHIVRTLPLFGSAHFSGQLFGWFHFRRFHNRRFQFRRFHFR